MTNEENFAEKDSSTHKEKASPIKMFCWQVVYLLFNFVPHSYYMQFRQIFISTTGFQFQCITEYIFSPETSIFSGLFLIFIGFVAYSITSISSFCVFIWAYMTENLQKHKVRFICNLPVFLMSIYILLTILAMMMMVRTGGFPSPM